MRPLGLYGSGMVTAVGLDAPSTCAAIRAAISGASETSFLDRGGERLLGCAVPMDSAGTGPERLAGLVAPAVQECLMAAGPAKPGSLPILLCLSGKERRGRIADLEDRMLHELGALMKAPLHPKSSAFSRGKTAILHALEAAERLIHEDKLPYCIVAGADSLLCAPAIRGYLAEQRLLSSDNSDGFIPGEAAAAVLVGPPHPEGSKLPNCCGRSRVTEKVGIRSEDPFRAEGLTAALRLALKDAGRTFDAVDYRISDVSGEQYGFKEAALALGRALRTRKSEFDLWHSADCIGEVGAALGPCMLGVALAAARKGYAPGPGVLCHFSADDGERGALVLSPIERAAT